MSFSYPPHLTILAWVFSDFFFWLTTKCPHAVPKCKQLSYQYIWPTLATYSKSCEWCEVKKTNFPTTAPWTVFRPIIADGKPSCPWLYTWSETCFRQDLFPSYLSSRRQFHAIVFFRLKSISDLDSRSLPRFFGEFIYLKLQIVVS